MGCNCCNLQKLQHDLQEIGEKIKHHEDNIKCLKTLRNKLEDSIIDMQGNLCHGIPSNLSNNLNIVPKSQRAFSKLLVLHCLHWLNFRHISLLSYLLKFMLQRCKLHLYLGILCPCLNYMATRFIYPITSELLIIVYMVSIRTWPYSCYWEVSYKKFLQRGKWRSYLYGEWGRNYSAYSEVWEVCSCPFV